MRVFRRFLIATEKCSNLVQLICPMCSAHTFILTLNATMKSPVHFMLGSSRLYLNLDNECNHAFVWMHVDHVTATQRQARDNFRLTRRAHISNLIFFIQIILNILVYLDFITLRV